MVIIRMSNCINKASGIVLSLSDFPMCRLRKKFVIYPEMYQDARTAKHKICFSGLMNLSLEDGRWLLSEK